MRCIAYKKGYKYQLTGTYSLPCDICPGIEVHTEHIHLMRGSLVIMKGYAWDGPSGPAIDTPNFMRGSLVHDALYQLIRMGWLPAGCRGEADLLLKAICLEDGMSKLRAWWVYNAVRHWGWLSTDPGAEKQVVYAPI